MQTIRQLRVELRFPRENLRIERGQRDVIERQADVIIGREESIRRLVKLRIEAVRLFGCYHVGKCQSREGFGKSKQAFSDNSKHPTTTSARRWQLMGRLAPFRNHCHRRANHSSTRDIRAGENLTD